MINDKWPNPGPVLSAATYKLVEPCRVVAGTNKTVDQIMGLYQLLDFCSKIWDFYRKRIFGSFCHFEVKLTSEPKIFMNIRQNGLKFYHNFE